MYGMAKYTGLRNPTLNTSSRHLSRQTKHSEGSDADVTLRGQKFSLMKSVAMDDCCKINPSVTVSITKGKISAVSHPNEG